MRQSRTSGSVGAAGEQSPVATQPRFWAVPVLGMGDGERRVFSDPRLQR